MSHFYFSALPNITTQPVSTTVREGDLNVTALSCLAFGIGPIHYQWEKYHTSNNSWIHPSSHRTVSVTSRHLNFSIIMEEDEGVYRCVVTNDDGSVTSDNATIHVYSEYPVELSKHSDITCIMNRLSHYCIHQQPHCGARRR